LALDILKCEPDNTITGKVGQYFEAQTKQLRLQDAKTIEEKARHEKTHEIK
jgi:hypothetical protein